MKIHTRTMMPATSLIAGVMRTLLIVALFVAHAPASMAAAARYTYSGGPTFTTVQNDNPNAIYDTSMSVSAFIVFADMLAPDISYSGAGGISVLPPTILDYSFFDGVQNLTPPEFDDLLLRCNEFNASYIFLLEYFCC